MRLLYSHRTKSADGQYVHIRALSEALKAQGTELFMAGPDDWGDGAPRALDAESRKGALARLPKPFYEAAELAYSAPAYFRLARAAATFRPDALYERYNLYYHAGARLSRARRLPFLLEVNAPLAAERAAHGGLALRPLAQASEDRLWRGADAVIAVTNVLARMIEARGADPARTHVMPNGVEADQLRARDAGPMRAELSLENRIVLGFVGFARPWHGLDRVLRALAALDHTDTHLLLVGDGDVTPALKALAAELGQAARFTVTGVVQHEKIADYVAAFDIALQPAATPYASPLKLFDYMAAGKAILAPDQPNIREILSNGADALLVPPDNDAALSLALRLLIDDAGLRARLGAAAKATLINRDFTWAGNARRVEEIAAALIDERARAASGVKRSPIRT